MAYLEEIADIKFSDNTHSLHKTFVMIFIRAIAFFIVFLGLL